jgi:hypothetical protein
VTAIIAVGRHCKRRSPSLPEAPHGDPGKESDADDYLAPPVRGIGGIGDVGQPVDAFADEHPADGADPERRHGAVLGPNPVGSKSDQRAGDHCRGAPEDDQ